MRKSKAASDVQRENDKRRAIPGLAGISWIVYMFDKLSAVIYSALVSGLFGRIFTSYSKELEAYNNSYFISYFKGGSKTRLFFRKIRGFLSKSFESSVGLKLIARFARHFAFVPLKTYGSFFMSFGIYTILVYFIKLLLPVMGIANIDYLFIGICVCIIFSPIYFSSLTLAEAIPKSKLTSMLFSEILGFREESFINKNKKSTSRTGIAVFLGLILGMLTFAINPFYILAIPFFFAGIALIMTMPEIGVLACIFFLPFFSILSNPTIVLTALVVLTSFSYFIKLIRGKRVFKLELIDFCVIFFMVLVLFSGIITLGGKSSKYEALISVALIFGYFLVTNLVRTQQWLKRCINAFVISGVLVAIVGVAQYILGMSPAGWLDTSYFPNIQGRATSVFDNPNYLAAYLALNFPFVLYKFFMAGNKKTRILTFICSALTVLCAIFTWSRGAWLAMLITALIFLMIFSKKTMRLIYSLIFIVPFLPFVLPHNVVSRFMSIGNMTESSISYRLYTWKGCGKLIEDFFWGGIGYGSEAFSQIYPEYAYAGMEAAVHSHSLYLQILINMGIAGLICFTFIALTYVQKSFEYLKKPVSNQSFLLVAAAMVSFFALLIMGIFDYVWYNYTVFFAFWLIMAFGVACIRIGKREQARYISSDDLDEYSASVDLEI